SPSPSLPNLGRGSFGSVVLVQNTDNDSFYALKVMKKESIVARRQVQHVSDEKAILSQIRHRHIVQLEGVFQDCHNVYFLMEYVGGGELYSFMRKVGALNRDQA